MPEEPPISSESDICYDQTEQTDSAQHIESENNADMYGVQRSDTIVSRFCTKCGNPLESPETACIECYSAAKPPLDTSNGKIDFEAVPVASSLWLYFLLLGSIILANILWQIELLTNVQMELLGTICFTMIVIIWAGKHYKLVTKELIYWSSGKWYVWAVLAALGTYGIATLYLKFICGPLGLEEYSYSEDFLVAGYGWSLVFLIFCVQPAIFEELAFRGVIFGSLKKVLNRREVIVVTALMFMILHLNVIAFPFLVIIGLVLGIIREKSQSLYPCILMHFTHNLLVILEEAGHLYVS